MQSNNFAFQRAEGFNGRSAGGTSYSQPSSWGVGAPGQSQGGYGSPQGYDAYAPQQPSSDVMTIDSVVQKSVITIGTVILAAIATWFFTGNLNDPVNGQSNVNTTITLMTVSSLLTLGLVLFIAFKRTISPALVMVFAVAEGVSIGALSKYFGAMFGNEIVTGAVIGTFAAASGTLAAYKFFNIQVSDKMRKFGVAVAFGMIGLILLNLVLGIFGVSMGIGGFGPLGFIFSVVGLGLGVFFLLLDFDFVEQGIAARLPEQESWRAAFGITLSLVLIYTNLLRILAILNQD